MHMNNNFFELNRKSLGEELANKIREGIINGKIGKGQWLKEEELANNFKISRTPVREALTILEKEGLILSVPYKGKIVIGIDEKSVRDSYILRAGLERLAIEITCPILESTDYVKLEEIINRLENSTLENSKSESKLYNNEFHWYIINKCGIERLKEWLGQLYNQFPKSIRYPTRGLEPIEEYRKILNALKDRDCDVAGELMQSHILRGEKKL